MIVIDGIIESLQPIGGITVLFQELLKRSNMDIEYYNYLSTSKIVQSNLKKCNHIQPRFLERYRDFNYPIEKDSIFHSTYYRLPKNKSNKVVTTVHDFTYEKMATGLPKKIHVWQKKRAILASDHIICVSKNTAKDLQYYYNIPDHKISIIYNGVSDEYFSLHRDSSDSRSLLFVGSRSGYKNFDLVVDAVKKMPEFNLKIVGSPLNENELKFLKNNLNGRFNYIGRLTNKELNVEYNNAFALIYPSSYEGFGIPVLEAMKTGCPVIAVNSSSIPEVVGDAGILLKKISVDELVDAINQIHSIRKELINRGLQQAKLFSWDKCYAETLDVYNKF